MKDQNTNIIRLSILAGLALVFLNVHSAIGQDGKIDPQEMAKLAHIIVSEKQAFESAAPIVTGEESFKNYPQWVQMIGNDPKWSAKVAEGLKFTDAVAWLKEHIAGKFGAADRAAAIDNAFREVYGRVSTPAEQAYWETQVKARKAWYATIVISESGKLNGNVPVRTEMVKQSYLAAFGRQPREKELQYWLPRTEHYRLIIDASRNWLHSPQGVTDLIETVKRALMAKSGKMPSDTEVKKAMISYAAFRAIYREM